MGTPMILDADTLREIQRLRAYAESNPVDMLTLGDRIKTADGKAAHMKQMDAQSMAIPMAYMVTFSVETGHPCGTARHMSMSVQREGRIPNDLSLWMVAQEFGFYGSLRECYLYQEKLLGHGQAINVVQPLEPPAKPS